MFVQFSTGSKFKHQINAVFVIEIGQQWQNVGMPERENVINGNMDGYTINIKSLNYYSLQMSLNFNLSQNLLFKTWLNQFRLVQQLESNHVFWIFFTGKIYSTKLAPSQRTANVKVINAPIISEREISLVKQFRINIRYTKTKLLLTASLSVQ